MRFVNESRHWLLEKIVWSNQYAIQIQIIIDFSIIVCNPNYKYGFYCIVLSRTVNEKIYYFGQLSHGRRPQGQTK